MTSNSEYWAKRSSLGKTAKGVFYCFVKLMNRNGAIIVTWKDFISDFRTWYMLDATSTTDTYDVMADKFAHWANYLS